MLERFPTRNQWPEEANSAKIEGRRGLAGERKGDAAGPVEAGDANLVGAGVGTSGGRERERRQWLRVLLLPSFFLSRV